MTRPGNWKIGTLNPHSANSTNYFATKPAPSAPDGTNWFGTDRFGRDMVARLLYGFRISIWFAMALTLTGTVIGVLMGAIQGYFGGLIDITGQRLIEIWSALPFLYIMILMGSVYGRSFMLLLGCYAIFNWIGISYYVRAEFLRPERTRDLHGLPPRRRPGSVLGVAQARFRARAEAQPGLQEQAGPSARSG